VGQKRSIRVNLSNPDMRIEVNVKDSQTIAFRKMQLLNLSRTGFYVCGESDLETGNKVEIMIPLKGGTRQISALANVRWVQNRSSKNGHPAGAGVQVSKFLGGSKDLWNDLVERSIGNLKLSDLMDRQFLALPPSSNTIEAARQMREQEKELVVIVDDHNNPQGLLTESDIISLVYDGKIEARGLESFVDKSITTISLKNTTGDAFSLMRFDGYRFLPVIEQGEIIGVVSETQLLPYWAEYMELQSERLSRDYQRAMGVVIHDLRTPISVITTANQLLKEGMIKPEEFINSGIPDMIDENCIFMNNLIGELLYITRSSLGVVKLSISEFDLKKLVSQIASGFEVSAKAKNINLVSVISPNKLLIEGDRPKITQILNNLISNAIKYSASGAAVTVSLNRTRGKAEIMVKDTGQGIPNEELPKLFNQFSEISTTPTAGEKKTGLGLSIVKSIVEAHDGTIEVESKVGVGSAFRVFLPI